MIAFEAGGVAHVLRAPTLAEIDNRTAEVEWERSHSGLPDLGFAMGAIEEWLVLDPCWITGLPVEALDRELLPDEARLDPREGSEAMMDGNRVWWRLRMTPAGEVDLPGPTGDFDSRVWVTYATAKLESDREVRDVLIEVGSDEEYRLYLNGELVMEYGWRRVLCTSPRPAPLSPDRRSGLTLRPGRNTLVLKVVSEAPRWSGTVRWGRGSDRFEPASILRASEDWLFSEGRPRSGNVVRSQNQGGGRAAWRAGVSGRRHP